MHQCCLINVSFTETIKVFVCQILNQVHFFSIVAVSDTYRDNISDGYSIPDEIPTTLAFSHVNWCKIDVFISNIMVLHHKMPQTVKINVNRYTNIYLLMNLFKINQFMFIFSYISALFSFIQQTIFLIILYFCCC